MKIELIPIHEYTSEELRLLGLLAENELLLTRRMTREEARARYGFGQTSRSDGDTP